MAGGYSSNNFVDFERKGWRGKLLQVWKWGWGGVSAPFRWLANAVVFSAKLAYAGWKHRKLKHLIFGLPSVLVAACTLYLSLSIAQASPATLGRKYLEAGRGALKAENWQAASLFLSRAADMGLRDEDTLFSIARAAQKSNDIPRMVSVLEGLAPADHPGYAPAHLWKANQILSGRTVGKEEGAEAEKHLKFALMLDPENPNAHGILGDLYFQAGLWPASIEHLRRAGNLTNDSKLMLAKATAATGNVESGRQYAMEVADGAKKRLEETPSDKKTRLELGEAYLLLERFEDAANVLQEGLKIEDDMQIRQSLALVLMHWSDSMLNENPPRRSEAFQLLSIAIEQSPNELLLFERMLALLREKDGTAENARQFLQQNIVSGRAAGISHLILGTDLLLDNQVSTAGVHLEQSFRLIPNGTVIANNYAWFLLHADPPDPDRALEIIDAVIAQDPNLAEFHETRGQILLAKEDWKGAIAELEKALAGIQPRAETHESLAKAYEKIGLADIAAQHREKAEQLAK